MSIFPCSGNGCAVFPCLPKKSCLAPHPFLVNDTFKEWVGLVRSKQKLLHHLYDT